MVDLRPMFGKSFGYDEVLTPNMDKHFLEGGGSAMQHSYVQISVVDPHGVNPYRTAPRHHHRWRSRRERTKVVLVPAEPLQERCAVHDAVNIFRPAWLRHKRHRQNLSPRCLWAANGKLLYGDSFVHAIGDDYRAWNHGATRRRKLTVPFDNATNQFSEEQFGTIPGPRTVYWDGTNGLT